MQARQCKSKRKSSSRLKEWEKESQQIDCTAKKFNSDIKINGERLCEKFKAFGVQEV